MLVLILMLLMKIVPCIIAATGDRTVSAKSLTIIKVTVIVGYFELCCLSAAPPQSWSRHASLGTVSLLPIKLSPSLQSPRGLSSPLALLTPALPKTGVMISGEATETWEELLGGAGTVFPCTPLITRAPALWMLLRIDVNWGSVDRPIVYSKLMAISTLDKEAAGVECLHPIKF